MNERLLLLATRHGALKARIAEQRLSLAEQVRPLEAALSVADRGVAGVDWLKRHPGAVGGAFAVLALLRPGRAWRWAKRGLVVWRGWQGVKQYLQRATAG